MWMIRFMKLIIWDILNFILENYNYEINWKKYLCTDLSQTNFSSKLFNRTVEKKIYVKSLMNYLLIFEEWPVYNAYTGK